MSRESEAMGGEVSFSFSVARLSQDGDALHFSADEAQRRTVAVRFDIVSVDRFEADLRAERWQRDGVSVEGSLIADVVQTDVVTLEPLSRRVEEPVRLFYVPEHSRLARPVGDEGIEVEVDLAEDDPETFHGDRVDLGEALVQILGLALDPYPRGEDVVFDEPAPEEKEPSPFAVLGKLRKIDD